MPVLSPVYGSGPHWSREDQLRYAITAHVLAGIILICCSLAQFDKNLRRKSPRIHRWTGRLYILAGLVMLASLRPLRATSGGFARPNDEASPAMALFIDVTSLAWLVSTAMAVFQIAVRRDFLTHRKWAATSLAFALTPLAQRLFLAFWVGFAMSARLAFDAVVYGTPIWRTAWGDTATWTGEPGLVKLLSFEGYGVAENAIFPLSAWAGFCSMLGMSCWLWHPTPHSDDNSSIKEEGTSANDELKGSASAGVDSLFDLNALQVLQGYAQPYSESFQELEKSRFRQAMTRLPFLRYFALSVAAAIILPLVIAMNAVITVCSASIPVLPPIAMAAMVGEPFVFARWALAGNYSEVAG